MDARRIWRHFERCKRKPGEDLPAFVDRFDRAYQAMRAACALELPMEIRVNMVLERSRVVEGDEDREMSEFDDTRRVDLHEQMKNQIREMLEDELDTKQEEGKPVEKDDSLRIKTQGDGNLSKTHEAKGAITNNHDN